MKLEEATESQLLAELKRRKRAAAPKPKPENEMDFAPLIDELITIVQRIAEGEHIKDIEDNLFTTLVECVFDGNTFWKWWHKV